MKFPMTEQEKGDLLKQVTALKRWTIVLLVTNAFD